MVGKIEVKMSLPEIRSGSNAALSPVSGVPTKVVPGVPGKSKYQPFCTGVEAAVLVAVGSVSRVSVRVAAA